MQITTQLILAMITGGVLSSIINKAFFGKKESAEYGLQLLKEMYRQHSDMRTEITELSKELHEYRDLYKSLQKQHNKLKIEYDQLKLEFETLKNKQN